MEAGKSAGATLRVVRVECPRCHQAIAGVDVDLASQLAVCRPCGEVVFLTAALAANPTDALTIAAPSRAAVLLYRPTDLSWSEGVSDAGIGRVTVVPPRRAAAPLIASALFWDALFLCWLPMLVDQPPAVFLMFPFVHLLVAMLVTHRAFCALINRTTVSFEAGEFAFVRRPIRQEGDVREPIANIVGFEAVSAVARAYGNAPRTRWGLHLLTRDGRAVPLRFDFADAFHARYAAARLTQMLADAQRGDAPYRG